MMLYFDFHHHNIETKSGILSLDLNLDIPFQFFSAGIHPKDSLENFEEKFRWLSEISKNNNCIAIGECGLDGLIDVPEDVQTEVFTKQILLANEIKKPIIIHCVRRFQEIINLKKTGSTEWIIHGFNKKEQLAQQLLDKGFFLSFGYATLHNVSLQQTIKNIPLDRLFLESDDAYFQISELYEKVAELKNITIHQLQECISENFEVVTYGKKLA